VAEERVQLFDEWADHYDESLRAPEGFPFEGYEDVLDTVVRMARAEPGMDVLDLGIGTGRLAERFLAKGCFLWGLDFSARMLARAHAKFPGIELVKADLLGDWPLDLDRKFHRIVSGYVLHEFDLRSKVRLLERLADRHLHEGGRIVVGDISFSTADALVETRESCEVWDTDEHYWAADEAVAVLHGAGLRAGYEQVSFCGGVYTIEPKGGGR
jgi:ubiquinone/menaquinone biosynthesis C-methylase UbiE